MTAPDPLVIDAISWPDPDGELISIGGANADLYLGDEGIEGLGQPAYRRQLTDRAAGGATGGRTVRGAATVSLTAWLDAGDGPSKDYDDLWRLYGAMNEREDPLDEPELLWSGLMWPGEHARFAMPSVCDWVTDEGGVHGGAPGLKLQWVSADPTTYSRTIADLAFGGIGDGGPVRNKDLTFTNEGSRETRAGGAWTLRLVAHDDVRSPYILDNNSDQIVHWIGLDMAAGDVLTVDRWRTARLGQQLVRGYARSANGSIFPDWPTLRRGVSSFRVGATAGHVSGNLHPRSTW